MTDIIPDPYNNRGHKEMATYRTPCGLRITLRTEGFAAYKSRPWMCVRNGTVTTRTGATAIEAMRQLGVSNPNKWSYHPG